MKPLVFVGGARVALREFPANARKAAGYELFQVQLGLEPSDWKPMSGIGTGVREIRLHLGSAFRVLYIATFAEAIYVLHAFEKRTRRTPRGDVDLARMRLRDLKQARTDSR